MIALVVVALIVAIARIPAGWEDAIFLGCWISVIGSAAAVHLPRAFLVRAVLPLSLNAGCWSGALVAIAGTPFDLLKALPCVLVLAPAAWIIEWRKPIVIKVVSSWLIAVAALAATLQCLPVTPGYMPDHIE